MPFSFYGRAVIGAREFCRVGGKIFGPCGDRVSPDFRDEWW